MDGTHIKANANIKKVVKEEVTVAAKRYAEELMEEVNADGEAHGKKHFANDTKEAKKKNVTKSTTDPDCGLFVKGEFKKQLAYEAHTACNIHEYILDAEVTPAMYMTAWHLTMYTMR